MMSCYSLQLCQSSDISYLQVPLENGRKLNENPILKSMDTK